MLDIDRLRSNPSSLIYFDLPTGIEEAFMIDDTFTFGASSNYTTAAEMVEELVSRSKVGAKVVEIVDKSKAGMSALTGYTMQNVMQSLMNYQGGTKPTFTLGMVFVAINYADDPRQKAIKFLEGVLPEKGEGGMMKAPWGYKALTPGAGRFSIKIGKWFQAFNLVLTQASFDFSKEVVTTDVPLYCVGSIAFETDKDIFAEDIQGYFP